jgi:hypothetical protein
MATTEPQDRDSLIYGRRVASVERARRVGENRRRVAERARRGRLDMIALARGNSTEAWALEAVANMRLDRFLLIIPGIGPETTHEILSALYLPPHRRLRDLSWHDRAIFANCVQAVANGEPVRVPTPWDP